MGNRCPIDYTRRATPGAGAVPDPDFRNLPESRAGRTSRRRSRARAPNDAGDPPPYPGAAAASDPRVDADRNGAIAIGSSTISESSTSTAAYPCPDAIFPCHRLE
jgi:hypothetical protein